MQMSVPIGSCGSYDHVTTLNLDPSYCLSRYVYRTSRAVIVGHFKKAEICG